MMLSSARTSAAILHRKLLLAIPALISIQAERSRNNDLARTDNGTTACDDGQQRFQKRRETVRRATALPQQQRRRSTRFELSKLRSREKEIMTQWERDEEGWRELPARAWPAFQPDETEAEKLKRKVQRVCQGNLQSSMECQNIRFHIATSLVFYNTDPVEGLKEFERLAMDGHVDAMVACGVILVEGLGVAPDESQGIAWLQKAVSLGSCQAFYELGTLFYTGVDGVLAEDEQRAFQLFERAAAQDHTAGLYMMADCLAEGEGTDKSVAQAVPLFYKAAERGHRFARQRIRELLANGKAE